MVAMTSTVWIFTAWSICSCIKCLLLNHNCSLPGHYGQSKINRGMLSMNIRFLHLFPPKKIVEIDSKNIGHFVLQNCLSWCIKWTSAHFLNWKGGHGLVGHWDWLLSVGTKLKVKASFALSLLHTISIIFCEGFFNHKLNWYCQNWCIWTLFWKNKLFGHMFVLPLHLVVLKSFPTFASGFPPKTMRLISIS